MSAALIRKLGEVLAETAGQRELLGLIVYLPFGIVRGELTGAHLQAASQGLSGSGGGDGMIELQRATVEHYSNHLPTGNYDRLCLSLKDISGFAIINS
jgi:hypothetical protein